MMSNAEDSKLVFGGGYHSHEVALKNSINPNWWEWSYDKDHPNNLVAIDRKMVSEYDGTIFRYIFMGLLTLLGGINIVLIFYTQMLAYMLILPVMYLLSLILAFFISESSLGNKLVNRQIRKNNERKVIQEIRLEGVSSDTIDNIARILNNLAGYNKIQAYNNVLNDLHTLSSDEVANIYSRKVRPYEELEEILFREKNINEMEKSTKEKIEDFKQLDKSRGNITEKFGISSKNWSENISPITGIA